MLRLLVFLKEMPRIRVFDTEETIQEEAIFILGAARAMADRDADDAEELSALATLTLVRWMEGYPADGTVDTLLRGVDTLRLTHEPVSDWQQAGADWARSALDGA